MHDTKWPRTYALTTSVSETSVAVRAGLCDNIPAQWKTSSCPLRRPRTSLAVGLCNGSTTSNGSQICRFVHPKAFSPFLLKYISE